LSYTFGSGAVPNTIGASVATFFWYAGLFGININLILMVLNLIPVPPLDGSRVVSSLLPPHIARKYELIEPYGIWILLGLIVFGFLSKILLPPVRYLMGVILSIVGLPLG